MKKYFVLFLVVLLIGGGAFVFLNKDKLFEKKVEEEPMEEIVSNDLFGKYYTSANAKLKKMTLEEKVGQLFLVRYDTNLAPTYISKYHAGG